MNNLLQRYKIVLPLALIALLATSCNSHGSKVFFFSFLFYVIFIILCLPAIILSGVARGNGSKSAKTTGLVFTCIGGFFAFIYTFNLIDDPHLKFIEEEIYVYLFLMWSSLIGATVLLSIPNPKMKAKESEMRIIHQEQYQRQQSGQIFSSEAEIVEYAEQIKTQQKAAPTPENSKYLNDDLSEDKKANQGPDMSGLDDLADL